MWEYFTDVGKPAASVGYSKGQLHGDYTHWYPSGGVRVKGQCERGRKIGRWELFHENGRLQRAGQFCDGGIVMDSPMQAAAADLHSVTRLRCCVEDRGTKDGTWTTWDEREQRLSDYSYKKGVLDGLCREWHPNGLRSDECTYVNGEIDGEWHRWDESGVLIWRARLERGAGSAEGYFASGRLESDGSMYNSRRYGQWRHYDEAGAIIAEGEYSNDERDGEWTERADSETSWVGSYRDGVKTGTWRRIRLATKEALEVVAYEE